MGNEAMTMGLEWTKKHEFRREPLHVWTIKGNQIAGLARSGGGLTFATIVGAGHMVRARPTSHPRGNCFNPEPTNSPGYHDIRLRTTSPSSRSSWSTGGWQGRSFELSETDMLSSARETALTVSSVREVESI